MTKLERLLFLQGGNCFFCAEPLPPGEASVEHLIPVAKGGGNADDNCVACCKAVNAALGSLPVKEKLRVVLSHRPIVKCPRMRPDEMSSDVACASTGHLLELALKRLQEMRANRPRKIDALRGSIRNWLPDADPAVVDQVVRELEAGGHVSQVGAKLVYPTSEVV